MMSSRLRSIAEMETSMPYKCRKNGTARGGSRLFSAVLTTAKWLGVWSSSSESSELEVKLQWHRKLWINFGNRRGH